jgi:hypothetical protein
MKRRILATTAAGLALLGAAAACTAQGTAGPGPTASSQVSLLDQG